MAEEPKLPAFVEPMLARRGAPFDSDEHLFEIKWDGFRGLVMCLGGRYRLRSRRDNDMLPRYPELAFLGDVEAGAVLDGELIVFRDGKPDFEALLQREQARDRIKIKGLSAALPVAFVAFDLLYRNYAPLFARPLVERRSQLEEVVRAVGHPRFVFSEGIMGAGVTFFENVIGQGLEGIVAKRLDSTYSPGRRSELWIKCKRSARAHCLILGYLPCEERDLRSLIVATDLDGKLTYVGKVGSGIGDAMRERLMQLLTERTTDTPLIPCDEPGVWVEPGLYCTVDYVELTKGGHFRAPVFGELIVE